MLLLAILMRVPAWTNTRNPIAFYVALGRALPQLLATSRRRPAWTFAQNTHPIIMALGRAFLLMQATLAQ